MSANNIAASIDDGSGRRSASPTPSNASSAAASRGPATVRHSAAAALASTTLGSSDVWDTGQFGHVHPNVVATPLAQKTGADRDEARRLPHRDQQAERAAHGKHRDRPKKRQISGDDESTNREVARFGQRQDEFVAPIVKSRDE